MRRGLVSVFMAIPALAAAQEPVRVVNPAPGQPGTVIVQPAPGTVVQPAPGTVVQPAPGTVIVQPAPGIVVQPLPPGVAVPRVSTPLTCPECRDAKVQRQRYLPPAVSVCIPGPPNYGPGPYLVSHYSLLSGPPYAQPSFAEGGVVTTTRVRLSYATGRAGEITVSAAGGATFPADVRVQSVTDTPNNLSWDVKKITVSPDRKQLTIGVEGKGLPTGSTGRPPEAGTLTVTLAGTGSLPRVDPVPVTYVVDR